MATITRPGRRSRFVKNPDWLPDHASEVTSIIIADSGDGSAVVTARLADGGVFMTTFADAGVAAEWVHRPSLIGVALTVIDATGETTRTTC